MCVAVEILMLTVRRQAIAQDHGLPQTGSRQPQPGVMSDAVGCPTAPSPAWTTSVVDPRQQIPSRRESEPRIHAERKLRPEDPRQSVPGKHSLQALSCRVDNVD